MKSQLLYSSLFALISGVTFAELPATNNANTPTVQTTPATENKAVAAPAPVTTTPVASTTTVVNCNYHIAPGSNFTDQAFVMKWADKAIEQAFDYDHSNVDQKLVDLKSCFTDQGWQSFNDALQKSGNINAIKSQKLAVNSMIEGQTSVTPIKDNQWKVSALLRVVYQNDKEKLVQPLAVDLIVGRKITGDLGIMQVIASPKTDFAVAPATSDSTTAKP